MPENQFDLIVIGAGPGGYVAAIRAAQLGMHVACVEKQYLGGVCLNVGCIPSKALLDSSEKFHAVQHAYAAHGIETSGLSLDLKKMLARKDKVVNDLTTGVGFLFKKNKVEHVRGTARITGTGAVEVVDGEKKTTLKGKNILIATGSAPTELPKLPFDGKNILNSTDALALPQVPKKLLVVGAGYIGLELGSVWARLGSEVLVVEFLDRCVPLMDKEMSALLQKQLEKIGIKFRFSTGAESAKVANNKIQVTLTHDNKRTTEECDKVLVAVGRRPATDGLGLAELGLQLDKRGFIPVGKRFETSIPGVFAIGDVIGNPMLAHKAEEEGVAAVELMSGRAGHVNYHAIPGVVYTHPELAQVGFTEDDAKAAGHEIKIGKFPFLANGRAKAMGETDGVIKVIADAKTDRVLGIHILGPHASDMIAEAVLAVEFAASSEDIARCVHAHPTLAEALKEAALAVDKRAIHM
jgi:dihydrolipoamide dehydrogenase